MDLKLHDIITEDDLREALEPLIQRILATKISVGLQPGGSGAPRVSKTLICPDCQEEFASRSGLAGHRYHKHGIRVTGDDLLIPRSKLDIEEETKPKRASRSK